VLDDLEKPWPTGKPTEFFERRGNSQTDRLLCSATIGHHKIRGHGIETSFHALHGGIERFEVDSDINSVRHEDPSSFYDQK